MSAKVMEYYNQITKSLYDKKQPWVPVLEKIEERTGVPRTYAFLGTTAFIALWLIFGFAAQLLCNLIGFAYPAYVSMKALETRAKEDDTRWLTYWVVFAWFSVTEFFSDILLSWLPVYWLLKAVFLLWCMAPIDNNGATVIYHRVVRGVFLKHQASIDNTFNKISSSASKVIGDLTGKKD